MASLGLKLSPFEPLITAPLLYVLTRSPPDIRDQIMKRISSMPYAPRVTALVKILKWLLALGLLARFTRIMNAWALNSWKINNKGEPWNWPTEVAVITGGCSGIGEKMVQKLCARGIKVAIMDVQPLPESLKLYSNVFYYDCDIASSENIVTIAAKIKSELGAPSILINNAGVTGAGLILDQSNDYHERTMRINLTSHWWTIKAFLPDMIAQRKGHIVATASMASYFALAGAISYSATKAGVLALHEGLSQELKWGYKAPYIRTTCVHPSWVATPLVGPFAEELTKAGQDIMTPAYVAEAAMANVFNDRSGQVILPPGMSRATSFRGWPTFVQEYLRDKSGRLLDRAHSNMSAAGTLPRVFKPSPSS